MTLFIILGAIGLALLIISLIFGDLFDFDGGGIISVPAIAVALVLFGASGAITTSAGLDPIWVYVVAIGCGIVAYLVAALTVRSLSRSSDGTPRDVSGDTGLAMSDITGSSGEVSLDGAGEIERRMAFADETIPQGTRIRVVQMYGSRIKVEPLARPASAAADTPTT